MAASDEVAKILKEHNAVLERHNKHEIWKFPNHPGKTFTRACSPSDCNAENNQLRQLKTLLNLNSPDRGEEGERREKKEKHGSIQPTRGTPTLNGVLAEKLALAGIAEAARLERITEQDRQIEQLRKERDYFQGSLERLKEYTVVKVLIWWLRVSRVRW